MTTRTRLTLTSALVVAGLGVAGCSGSPGTTPGPATGSARASSSPTAPGPGTAASASPTTKATAKDPRAHLPVATPARSVSVSYAGATSKDKARLAPVKAASADLIDSSTVRSITVGGRSVGTVGVYTVKKSAGSNPIFQDQYLVQLLNAVGGSKTKLKFVKVQGNVTALSTGPVRVVGWFSGNQVTVVVPTAGQTDLVGLAAGMQDSPLKG